MTPGYSHIYEALARLSPYSASPDLTQKGNYIRADHRTPLDRDTDHPGKNPLKYIHQEKLI
jgi:hypothetical protein